MMEKYFGPYWSALGMNRETFFQLGINPEASTAGFNMTAFAMRMSACHNAVSKKHGVDVWLNSPLPPMEASGTSVMKAALNGVPHLSIMDGWWLEGFNGKNGWAYGRTEVDGDRYPSDAENIYRILENEIILLFYKVSDDGIPHNRVRIIKEPIKSNGPLFSAWRIVKGYVQKYYPTALDAIEIK
jgi:starch phosphorylase